MRRFSRRPSAGEMVVTAALMICMVVAVAAIGVRLARSGSEENQKVELEEMNETAEKTEEEDSRIETTGESVVNEGIPDEFIEDSAELPMDMIAAEDQVDVDLADQQASAGEENMGADAAKDQTAQAPQEQEEEPVTEEDSEAQEASADAAAVQAELSFQAEDKLSWPVRGNVVLDYSMDASIYFPTLEQYKYNPAVMISGEVGTEVKAAADGIVASIASDAETGTTVTMDLGNGYQAVYGQLKDVSVTEGSYVAQDTVLGYINEPTKYYSVEGSNLYFQVNKDGEPVDPLDYLQ